MQKPISQAFSPLSKLHKRQLIKEKSVRNKFNLLVILLAQLMLTAMFFGEINIILES